MSEIRSITNHSRQLAVELAKRCNGEIINGDAMQLYAGLPIITNKILEHEKQGVPHHLLGLIELNEPTWTVGKFVTEAGKVIQEIRSRGKLPILVGGTHYYTQHLLFDSKLADEETVFTEEAKLEERWPILSEPTPVLLEKLQEVDPISAQQWHPNDHRKIRRSLMIYLQTGKPASEIYAAQKQSSELAVEASTNLRYSPLLFWVHAETESLRSRLANRVDQMVDRGLMDEVSTLQNYVDAEITAGREVDEGRGIWVSIGFKEFKPYMTACANDEPATILAKAKAECIERTKIATRQYAKRQIHWISIQLRAALESAEIADRLYLLDGTDVSRFDETVVKPAVDIASSFLEDRERPRPPDVSSLAAEMLTNNDKGKKAAQRSVQHCEACDVTCGTIEAWERHTSSRKHRKLVSKLRQEPKASRETEINGMN